MQNSTITSSVRRFWWVPLLAGCSISIGPGTPVGQTGSGGSSAPGSLVVQVKDGDVSLTYEGSGMQSWSGGGSGDHKTLRIDAKSMSGNQIAKVDGVLTRPAPNEFRYEVDAVISDQLTLEVYDVIEPKITLDGASVEPGVALSPGNIKLVVTGTLPAASSMALPALILTGKSGKPEFDYDGPGAHSSSSSGFGNTQNLSMSIQDQTQTTFKMNGTVKTPSPGKTEMQLEVEVAKPIRLKIRHLKNVKLTWDGQALQNPELTVGKHKLTISADVQ